MDLLVVLQAEVPLVRGLYRPWDAEPMRFRPSDDSLERMAIRLDRARGRARNTLVALTIGLAWAAPLRGQQASPWLPPDHWTRPLLIRLHALGLATHDPVATERTLLQAAAGLTPGYRNRLAEERPGAPGNPMAIPAGPGAVATPATFLLELGPSAIGHAGTLEPGRFTLDRVWSGPAPIPDDVETTLTLRIEAMPLRRLAITLAAAAGRDSFIVDHATVDLRVGGVALWGGRRPIGYSPGEGGGLVLTGVDRFNGAGARLERRQLPLLGSLSAEAFGGPTARNGHVDRPWLLGTRVHARPHPRLDAGATRVAIFGGMNDAGVGPRQILEVLVGANLAGDYADDQVASVDARWRPPAPVPVELYGEWGMHDIDLGVLIDMPTFTFGVRVPRLPALGSAGASLEHTRISRSCCENPPWYHHFELADNWTARGALLGHPLGGHGHQWRLGVSAAAQGAAIVVDAAAIERRRGAENLFAPDREGRATALELNLHGRLTGRSSAALRLTGEWGRQWSEWSARLAGRLRL